MQRTRWRGLRQRSATAWIVAGLTVLAFALRWACVHESLFGDELILYFDVHGRSLGQVISTVHDTEKTPPLGFVLGWLLARGSDAAVLVRLPSLVAGVATVPVIYLLGMRTVGRWAGVVAAAWFALSGFEIFYGTEARGYALVTAFVVVSTLGLLAALDERRPRWWALYVLAAAAAVYTHYIAVLVLVPQAAWALWAYRDRAREQLIAHGLVVVAFLPWLVSFLVQLRHSREEAARLAASVPLSWTNVYETEVKSLVGHPFLELRQLPGHGPLIVLAAVLVAAIGLVVAGLPTRGDRSPAPAPRRGLVALLALAPIAGLVLYCLRPHTSFLLPRNVSVAVPYALLLFGWLLTRPGPRVGAALSIIALGAVAAGTLRTFDPDHRRPDVRAAARFIDMNAPPGAPVIDASNYPFSGSPARGMRVYFKRSHPIYESLQGTAAWGTAARRRSPVFFSTPGGLLALLGPPRPYATRFRFVALHTSRGLRPIFTREYAFR